MKKRMFFIVFVAFGVTCFGQSFNPLAKEYTLVQAQEDNVYFNSSSCLTYEQICAASANGEKLKLTPKQQIQSDNFKKMFLNELAKSRLIGLLGINMENVKKSMVELQIVITRDGEKMGRYFSSLNLIWLRYADKWADFDDEMNVIEVASDKERRDLTYASLKTVMRHEAFHHLIRDEGIGLASVLDEEGEVSLLEEILREENQSGYGALSSYEQRAIFIESIIKNVGFKNYFNCGKYDIPKDALRILWNSTKSSKYVSYDLVCEFLEFIVENDIAKDPRIKGEFVFINFLEAIPNPNRNENELKIKAQTVEENIYDFIELTSETNYDRAKRLGIDVDDSRKMRELVKEINENMVELDGYPFDSPKSHAKRVEYRNLILKIAKDKDNSLTNEQILEYEALDENEILDWLENIKKR